MTVQDTRLYTQVEADIAKISGNPFPGLRSFIFEESNYFFGQDTVSSQIIEKIRDNRFVFMLGGAGVGKTSLINCAVTPLLISGIYDTQPEMWHVFQTTPGNNPLLNLADVFQDFQTKDETKEQKTFHQNIRYNILQRGKQGLIELISQFRLPSDHRYLFIIDQFEDLIRLYSTSGIEFHEEAIHYVNLFIEALENAKSNIYVVISIRSDFTDDCNIFPNLSTYINKSNILIPRMTREQLTQVILGPLRMLKVKIEDSLLSHILNEAAIAEDMLPRLQHSLRMMWESWIGLNNRNNSITIKEYEVGGGIRHSISNQANLLFDELSTSDKKICESIFKSLTERGSENKGLLRPTSVMDLAQIARTEPEDIIRVVNIFRNGNTAFLICPQKTIQSDSIVSIAHVSLIRIWNRLKIWVEDEAISGQMYKQLSETSASYQVGKSGLMQPPDLQFAMNWKEKQQPTLHWARRYNPAYERAMVYLRSSHEKFQAEETLKHNRAKKAMKKVRSISILLSTALVLASVVIVYFQIVSRNAKNQQKIAVEQKTEAVVKSQKAEQTTKEALEEKWKAEMAANEAEKTKKMAVEETKELTEEKSVAEVSAQEAIKKSTETEKNLVQVSKQKEQIEQTVIQANLQKNEAEKEKDEIFKKRLQTTAITIASKSLLIQGNKNLKSDLALHAYSFNNRYGGIENPPEIYYALNSALSDEGISARYDFKGHIGSVKSLCISARSNILYSTGGDGNVFAWNLHEASPTPRLIFKNSQGNLCLCLSPNAHYLAIGTESGSIKIIDLTNPNAPAKNLKGHQGPTYCLAFSKDASQIFSCGADRMILAWDIASGNSTKIFQENTTIRSIALTPDNKFLAGGTDDGRVLLWDITTNQLFTLQGNDANPIYAVAFNRNGTLLASGDIKGGIKLWNPYSRKLVKVLKNHSARVVDISFSQTSELMTSSSYDGTAFIFDTRFINNPPIVIKEPSTWILAVAFSNDNKKLILGTNKPGFIFSMPAQTKVMSDMLCGKVTKGLSQEEWNLYIGNDVKYEKPCE